MLSVVERQRFWHCNTLICCGGNVQAIDISCGGLLLNDAVYYWLVSYIFRISLLFIIFELTHTRKVVHLMSI